MDEVEFGRYRLIELIGSGGMGEVLARARYGHRPGRSHQVLPPKLSKDEEFQRRFRREAQAAARLEPRTWSRSMTTGRSTAGSS